MAAASTIPMHFLIEHLKLIHFRGAEFAPAM
jgi:hypothetical protein